jgi:beta-glucanase (GH16 family)
MKGSFRDMPRQLHALSIAALLLCGLPACSEGSAPQSSSSSHWLGCDTDEDCGNLPIPASCGAQGFCVAESGREIEARSALEADFEGDTLDTDVFGFETGFALRNGDLQAYTAEASNSFLEDGELVLEARAESFEEAGYTSASIQTKGKQAFLYGRIEAELKAPSGAGVDPSFWMLPESPGAPARTCDAEGCTEGAWPAWGDVVIASLRSEPGTALHGLSYASEVDGQLSQLHDVVTSELVTTGDGYHVYRLDWGPGRMDWFVDDERVHTVDLTDSAIYLPEGEHPFRREFYLKLSLAVGGLAATPVADDFPQQMRVRRLGVTQYE